MPPKEQKLPDKGKQPDKGKRKADQDQGQSSNNAVQPSRKKAKPMRRSQGDTAPAPYVPPSEFGAMIMRSDQGITGLSLLHTPSNAQEPLQHFTTSSGALVGGRLPFNQMQSTAQKAVNATSRFTGNTNPDMTFLFSIEGAMTGAEADLCRMLGSDDRKRQPISGKKALPASKARPAAKAPSNNEPVCGNCGLVGHVAKQCVKVTGIGDIEACIICNTKDHYLDNCLEWKKLDKLGRFLVITKGRANLPFVRCGTEDCFDLARQPGFERLGGYPWSRKFACKFYRQCPNFWRDYNYKTNSPPLPRDEATINYSVVHANLDLVSRFIPKEDRQQGGTAPTQPPSRQGGSFFYQSPQDPQPGDAPAHQPSATQIRFSMHNPGRGVPNPFGAVDDDAAMVDVPAAADAGQAAAEGGGIEVNAEDTIMGGGLAPIPLIPEASGSAATQPQGSNLAAQTDTNMSSSAVTQGQNGQDEEDPLGPNFKWDDDPKPGQAAQTPTATGEEDLIDYSDEEPVLDANVVHQPDIDPRTLPAAGLPEDAQSERRRHKVSRNSLKERRQQQQTGQDNQDEIL